MESLDYNFVGAAMPQVYHYMGYGADLDIFQQTGNACSTSVESNNYDPGVFNIPFDPVDGQSGLATASQMTTSSPPSQRSPLPMMSFETPYNVKFEQRSNRTSSSEETDDVYAAQARRKAQNRAAQRAFRERKERHVRDLEAKIARLETALNSLKSSNERLEAMLQRAQSENAILRARTSSLPFERQPKVITDDLSSSLQATPASGAIPHIPKTTPANDTDSLSAAAVLDFLQSHPLYLSGALDIGKVCERLKEKAQCDATKESILSRRVVCGIIEQVGRSGNDVGHCKPALVDPLVTG